MSSSTTSSLVRFLSQKYFLLFKRTLLPTKVTMLLFRLYIYASAFHLKMSCFHIVDMSLERFELQSHDLRFQL
jgi:hypothetical protein